MNFGVLSNFYPCSHKIQLVTKSCHFYLLNVFGTISSVISCPWFQFKLFHYHSFGLLKSLPNWSCCFGINHLIQRYANYIGHGSCPACCLFFFKSKMLLNIPCLSIYLLSMVVSVLQWQTCIVVTETAWPTKLKIFTFWPFINKVRQSWYKSIIHSAARGIFQKLKFDHYSCLNSSHNPQNKIQILVH